VEVRKKKLPGDEEELFKRENNATAARARRRSTVGRWTKKQPVARNFILNL